MNPEARQKAFELALVADGITGTAREWYIREFEANPYASWVEQFLTKPRNRQPSQLMAHEEQHGGLDIDETTGAASCVPAVEFDWKTIYGDLADSPWAIDGAMQRWFAAICGNLNSPMATLESVAIAFLEARKIVEPGFEIPHRLRAHKATRNRAKMHIFDRLGIEPIQTANGATKQTREKVSKAVKDWWKGKAPDCSEAPVYSPKPASLVSNNGAAVNSSEAP